MLFFCPIRQLQPVTATYEPNKNTKKTFKGFKSLKCKLFKQNKRNYDYSILTVHVNNVTFQGIKQQKIADELERMAKFQCSYKKTCKKIIAFVAAKLIIRQLYIQRLK